MQHLNLYGQLDRAVEPPFSARQQAVVLIVIVTVMFSIYLLQQVNKASLYEELDNVQQQQKVVASQLDKLNAKKAKLERENSFDQDISRLQNDIKFRRRLLASIDPASQTTESGFSEHLTGLARQHIDGMWFTEIQLKEGGRQLALIGETRSPELVPRYVQKLAEEKVFVGHQFRVFRLSAQEENRKVINFELRAKEIE